ncbi:MAG: ABC transporter substrate-binding protein [Deltaproteobacteria bacterium]|nr:ABC transporter substrate-binding protein [Deltaproteobacteria bacterium]
MLDAGAFVLRLETWNLKLVAALLLACAAAFLSGCPRTVVVDGREMRYDDAAAMRLSAARDLQKDGKADAAFDAFQTVARDYPESAAAPEAKLAIASILVDGGKHKEAAQGLQKFLFDHPAHPQKARAMLLLSTCEAKAGDPRYAGKLFDQAMEILEAAGGREADAAAAIAGGADGTRSVRVLARLWKKAKSSAEREQIGARVLKTVDDGLSPPEVRELYETVPRGEFPREIVVYKVARLLIHEGRTSAAYAVFGEYLDAFPDGRFADAARLVRNRLAALQKVDPAAVGVLLPMSGEYRLYGEQMMRAVRLGMARGGAEAPDALEKFEEGEYRTADGLKFILRDTAGDADRAARAMEDLVGKHHVIGVIGPVFTGPAASAAFKAEELGVPLMTLSRKEGITEAGPWVLRNCLTNSAQAAAIARYAFEKLEIKSFAIIFPNMPYGVELSNYFWDAVEGLGGEVVGVESYEADQTTFTPQARKLVGKFFAEARRQGDVKLPKWAEGLTGYRLKKVMEKYKGAVAPHIDFDAVFIPDYADKVALVVPALAVEDVMFSSASKSDLERARKATGFRDFRPVQLLGANGWNSDKLPERAGKYVDGSVFVDGFFAGSSNEETKVFVSAFTGAFGKAPGLLEAQAYDSARIFLDVLRTARPGTRDALRQALLGVKDFPGAAGKTSFAANGEVRKEVFILTVDDGEIREIGRIVP